MKKLEDKLRFLEYEHKVMELRRAICFKAFLSCIVLDLLLLKGFFEYRGGLTWANYLVAFLFCCIMLLFGGFVFQIEKKNRSNRQRYIALSENIWNVIKSDSDDDVKITYTEERPRESFMHSWAATWPFFTVVLLTVVFCLALCL